MTAKKPATRIRKRGPVDKPAPRMPRNGPVVKAPAPAKKRQLKNPGSGKPNAMTKLKQLEQEGKINPRGIYATAPDQDLDQTPGKPVRFSPELGVRVCRLLAQGTPALRIWALDGFPSEATFFRWMAKEGKEFDLLREEVARAREQRANQRAFRIESYITRMADPEAATIAGLSMLDPQQAKVAIDGERILMECEHPKKYGKALTLKGDKDQPLRVTNAKDLTDAELLALASGGLEKSDA